MKVQSILMAFGFVLIFSACSQRSVPAAAVSKEFVSEQSNVAKVEKTHQKTAEGLLTTETNLSPLTENSLGHALLGCIKEVESVTVTSTKSGEVLYESTDDVLSQGFYDAMQIINEEFETLDIRPIDYEVEFTTMLGINKSYGIWVNFTKDNNVIVQSGDALWDIPIVESNWIRTRLTGLA